jgi:nuclear transport factor 2 (NTF2) superfamily protein
MALQAAQSTADKNPRNDEEARALIKHVESLFMPWNIDALVAGFTEDCVVRFGTVAEFRGREKLRTFFETRSARQKNYRLKKTFRSLSGDIIANAWSGEWQDAESGAAMTGYGIEIWQMRDGKIALWEAAFNVARADQSGGVADLLR